MVHSARGQRQHWRKAPDHVKPPQSYGQQANKEDHDLPSTDWREDQGEIDNGPYSWLNLIAQNEKEIGYVSEYIFSFVCSLWLARRLFIEIAVIQTSIH